MTLLTTMSTMRYLIENSEVCNERGVAGDRDGRTFRVYEVHLTML